MYLKHIGIKNIGPIDKLLIEMPFDKNGNPKPIIFVGKNGTGKTILLAQIVDALYEIGGALFRNIRKHNNDMSYSLYKINGNINLKIGKDKGFSVLRFESFAKKVIEYYDKVGNVTSSDFKSIIKNFQLKPQQIKDTTNIRENKELQQEWKQYAHFYLPAYRYEEPFWKNLQGFEREITPEGFSSSQEYQKELIITSSEKANEDYLTNLWIDYLINSNTRHYDKPKIDNVRNIAQKVKQNNEAHPTFVSNRNAIDKTTRLRIALDKNNTALNHLNQLSLGESVLFNMFVNVMRHTDMADEPKGIVIIDEIDTHLHANLQNKVLPQLIKMFPKIQFIITTHSPLFVLGMKEEFGDNFMLYDMPNGNIINPERFSEFQSAYAILQNTETFEKDLEQKIRSLNKPIVFVEGPTDVQYIKRACESFDRQDLLKDIHIDIIGEQTSNGTKNSNNAALKQAAMFLKANPNLIPNKILLLNDPEEDIKYGEKYSSKVLHVDKMPFFDSNPIKKGIENLFPQETIEKIRQENDDFIDYSKIKKEKKYGINKECKMQVCDWLCENGTKEDFKNFESIIEILDNFLGKENNRP
ncbi:AAA family ATPase [Helicobacter rodentium]|uniref:AAA family ATPase n=1 Tax=Helicobacter rodentium TaxID=59617 RepID=UPI00263A9F7E|nr:AAA family ATPase [Helicobacter rodentium]